MIERLQETQKLPVFRPIGLRNALPYGDEAIGFALIEGKKLFLVLALEKHNSATDNSLRLLQFGHCHSQQFIAFYSCFWRNCKIPSKLRKKKRRDIE